MIRSNNNWAKITIALFLMFGCAIGIAIVASNAGAGDPPWAHTLEGRVAHLESELNDENAQVIYTLHYARDLEERITQNEDRSRALVACVRNRSYTFNRRMMAQCIDDWFDAYAEGDY